MAKERVSLSPYNYCSDNPIMRIDPTGALDDDYYFNKKGEMVGQTKTDNKDRIFTENSKGNQTLEGSKLKFSEDKNPDFAIVQIKTDMENFQGHTAVSYDGKAYGFYPTDSDGDRHYGLADNNTPLVMKTQSNSEFSEEYPKANTFFIKVTPSEKIRLDSWLKVQNSEINNGTGGNYRLISNNCTTNIGKALNFTFNKPILSNVFVKPSYFNDALVEDYNGNAKTRIIKTDIQDYGTNLSNSKH